MNFNIVEKKNRFTVHAAFHTLERAERHLKVVLPAYCEQKLFMDKTLKPEDFEIIITTL